ncbi:hypothetical protein NP493_81g03059 [Ridgeia piscesae]|uniref:5'-AMP-activated protein kinase subunit beta-1 n=1 Tax=Ridgeia piscesae TaxID=27915 RepID=A0AAD9P959_RIDPI|nr:hypothetical protein NP493_81g03059 [Ridgeia piscesae]
MTRLRASTLTSGEDISSKKLPTVFKWDGGGKAVYIAGSYDNWKDKIPMVKSHGDFYTIIDLPEGTHQYKFYVDGHWVCDDNAMKVDSVLCSADDPSDLNIKINNDLGTENNCVTVKSSDFEVFEALAMDSIGSTGSKPAALPLYVCAFQPPQMPHVFHCTFQTNIGNTFGTNNNTVTVKLSDFEVFEALDTDNPNLCNDEGSLGTSPPGEYSQIVPPRNAGMGFHHSGPPILPPHLLQVILNKEVPQHCEPTLLPEPNHVMLNHLYALSIKDGVMVLSATVRYRKKYVTTLLYKPI